MTHLAPGGGDGITYGVCRLPPVRLEDGVGRGRGRVVLLTESNSLLETLVCRLHQLLALVVNVANKERFVEIAMETAVIRRDVH